VIAYELISSRMLFLCFGLSSIATIGSLKVQDSDSSGEEGQAYYAGGSEHGGLVNHLHLKAVIQVFIYLKSLSCLQCQLTWLVTVGDDSFPVAGP